MTAKVLHRGVWAGTNNGSYPLASEALWELAGIRLSPKQIRRLVEEIGQARLAESAAAVARLKAAPLRERRQGSSAHSPPELAVISPDGGRYQRRDNFRGEPTREEGGQHWRETKVGCLLSMESEVFEGDPAPQFPEWLATSPAIAELANLARAAESLVVAEPAESSLPAAIDNAYQPPELLAREVLASSQTAEEFAWQLEARAWQLGFPAAERQAFVADGAPTNWTIQRRHFPRATPILDLMHALSYAWAAAQAVDEGGSYRSWAQWIWQGEVSRVIDELTAHQQRLGLPPPETDAHDPRRKVERALTYYTHNRQRMRYPAYRCQGLPLTSSHIESTIKLINQRIKGSEKFWRRSSGEAVLQLRADFLSDSRPLDAFWRRWQSQQTGANTYRTAA